MTQRKKERMKELYANRKKKKKERKIKLTQIRLNTKKNTNIH